MKEKLTRSRALAERKEKSQQLEAHSGIERGQSETSLSPSACVRDLSFFWRFFQLACSLSSFSLFANGRSTGEEEEEGERSSHPTIAPCNSTARTRAQPFPFVSFQELDVTSKLFLQRCKSCCNDHDDL